MTPARIESLAYGPHGVARIDGKVHFVRQVAPGDEVELDVREDRGSYAYSAVTRLVRAGPARREPPCEYLPRCGGCPWQHIEYAAQADAKEQAVGDLLSRVGGIAEPPVRPIIRATREYGYRRRLSLRVQGRRVGFLAAASHDLVPVERCLLAAPGLGGAIGVAQRWIENLATAVERIEIAATGEEERFVFVAQADGRFVSRDSRTTEELLAGEPRLAGAVLRGRGWRRVWGEESVAVPLPGGAVRTDWSADRSGGTETATSPSQMRLRAGDFTQVNDSANAELVRIVLDLARLGPDDCVADLYAGAGNLSLPLALRAARVLAVDRVAASTSAAAQNARRLGLSNLETTAGEVGRVLAAWAASGVTVDVAVLDPPRSGAADAVPALARLGARRIVYVSCNPATLARDVRALSASYALEVAQPIDFFPQTYHVETVALLVRRAGRVAIRETVADGRAERR